MNARVWVTQAMSAPAPADFAAYLLQHEWKVETTNANWAVYTMVQDGVALGVEVPQHTEARDYPRVVRMLLEDLARIEARDPATILRDVKASTVDIVRLTIESAATRDGRIPVEAGRRVYDGARDLLLAAACAAVQPRPAFAQRKPSEALALLQRARFGQTEVGSFVLTIECAVPPRLQPRFFDNDDDSDAPLERRTCVLLAKAVAGVAEASREAGASDQLQPFHARIEDGVSANLCDAIAELVDATTAEAVRTDISFASRRPVRSDVPRSAIFTPDVVPILREAARQLRARTTYPGTDVEGPVIKLISTSAADGGDVIVHTLVDGKPRTVQMTLGTRAYGKAIEAHRAGVLVHALGDLERDARGWVLRNPGDIDLVGDPALD